MAKQLRPAGRLPSALHGLSSPGVGLPGAATSTATATAAATAEDASPLLSVPCESEVLTPLTTPPPPFAASTNMKAKATLRRRPVSPADQGQSTESDTLYMESLRGLEDQEDYSTLKASQSKSLLESKLKTLQMARSDLFHRRNHSKAAEKTSHDLTGVSTRSSMGLLDPSLLELTNNMSGLDMSQFPLADVTQQHTNQQTTSEKNVPGDHFFKMPAPPPAKASKPAKSESTAKPVALLKPVATTTSSDQAAAEPDCLSSYLLAPNPAPIYDVSAANLTNMNGLDESSFQWDTMLDKNPEMLTPGLACSDASFAKMNEMDSFCNGQFSARSTSIGGSNSSDNGTRCERFSDYTNASTLFRDKHSLDSDSIGGGNFKTSFMKMAKDQNSMPAINEEQFGEKDAIAFLDAVEKEFEEEQKFNMSEKSSSQVFSTTLTGVPNAISFDYQDYFQQNSSRLGSLESNGSNKSKEVRPTFGLSVIESPERKSSCGSERGQEKKSIDSTYTVSTDIPKEVDMNQALCLIHQKMCQLGDNSIDMLRRVVEEVAPSVNKLVQSQLLSKYIICYPSQPSSLSPDTNEQEEPLSVTNLLPSFLETTELVNMTSVPSPESNTSVICVPRTPSPAVRTGQPALHVVEMKTPHEMELKAKVPVANAKSQRRTGPHTLTVKEALPLKLKHAENIPETFDVRHSANGTKLSDAKKKSLRSQRSSSLVKGSRKSMKSQRSSSPVKAGKKTLKNQRTSSPVKVSKKERDIPPSPPKRGQIMPVPRMPHKPKLPKVTSPAPSAFSAEAACDNGSSTCPQAQSKVSHGRIQGKTAEKTSHDMTTVSTRSSMGLLDPNLLELTNNMSGLDMSLFPSTDNTEQRTVPGDGRDNTFKVPTAPLPSKAHKVAKPVTMGSEQAPATTDCLSSFLLAQKSLPNCDNSVANLTNTNGLDESSFHWDMMLAKNQENPTPTLANNASIETLNEMDSFCNGQFSARSTSIGGSNSSDNGTRCERFSDYTNASTLFKEKNSFSSDSHSNGASNFKTSFMDMVKDQSALTAINEEEFGKKDVMAFLDAAEEEFEDEQKFNMSEISTTQSSKVFSTTLTEAPIAGSLDYQDYFRQNSSRLGSLESTLSIKSQEVRPTFGLSTIESPERNSSDQSAESQAEGPNKPTHRVDSDVSQKVEMDQALLLIHQKMSQLEDKSIEILGSVVREVAPFMNALEQSQLLSKYILSYCSSSSVSHGPICEEEPLSVTNLLPSFLETTEVGDMTRLPSPESHKSVLPHAQTPAIAPSQPTLHVVEMKTPHEMKLNFKAKTPCSDVIYSSQDENKPPQSRAAKKVPPPKPKRAGKVSSTTNMNHSANATRLSEAKKKSVKSQRSSTPVKTRQRIQ